MVVRLHGECRDCRLSVRRHALGAAHGTRHTANGERAENAGLAAATCDFFQHDQGRFTRLRAKVRQRLSTRRILSASGRGLMARCVLASGAWNDAHGLTKMGRLLRAAGHDVFTASLMSATGHRLNQGQSQPGQPRPLFDPSGFRDASAAS